MSLGSYCSLHSAIELRIVLVLRLVCAAESAREACTF